VLAGVDLRLTAVPTGFHEVLVVETRPAAQNPRLAKLRFGIRGPELSLRAGKDGGVDLVDAKGGWRSRRRRRRCGTRSRSRSAVGRFELAGDGLSVVPDRKLLTDPATVFPVSIDPDFLAPFAGWAKVFSGNGGSEIVCQALGGTVDQCHTDPDPWIEAITNLVGEATGLHPLARCFQGNAGSCLSAGTIAAWWVRGAIAVVAAAVRAAARPFEVNPTGDMANCGNCVIAGDATRSGVPTVAKLGTGRGMRGAILEEYFNNLFRQVSGREEIEHMLSQAGPGARGIVLGTRFSGSGHYFQAENVNGKGHVFRLPAEARTSNPVLQRL